MSDFIRSFAHLTPILTTIEPEDEEPLTLTNLDDLYLDTSQESITAGDGTGKL